MLGSVYSPVFSTMKIYPAEATSSFTVKATLRSSAKPKEEGSLVVEASKGISR